MPKFDLFSMLVFGLVACACNAKQAGESETTGNIEQTLTDPDGPPPPREPPKEAFAACAESSEGDTCSVVLGDRTIDGDCRRGPNGEGQLACAPTTRLPPREPPKEAFVACAESSEGDTCSVVLGDRTIDGDCRRGPNGEGQLACAPHHPEPPVPDARLDE